MEKTPEKMTRAELLRAEDAANRVSSQTCTELIAAGYGNYTMATMRAHRQTNPLFERYIRECEWESELSFEKSRRRQHDGSLHRIKFKA